jgi:CHASE3 domain sensor protein
VITPEAAIDLRHGERFDLVTALLLGLLAVLASLLAVVQIGTSQQTVRAQQQASRLTVDLLARLEVSGMVQQVTGAQEQAVVALSLEGSSRELAGIIYGDEGAGEIGAAEFAASIDLGEALAATARTVSGAPLDAYMAGLIDATIDELTAEVNEQNDQVDLADDADSRNTRSVLGLSFLALAGVLTGLGAVLREGRAGWFALVSAGGMSAAATVMAILAVV